MNTNKSNIIPLNLPICNLQLKEVGEVVYVLDTIRKKWFQLTPEEWVRQHVIGYLVNELKYPASLLEIEKSLKVNSLDKRADIVVNNEEGKPSLIVECKAPHIKIDQKTFDQIARYNLTLNVDYLMVTNGLDHFICTLNFQSSSYNFIEEFPRFKNL